MLLGLSLYVRFGLGLEGRQRLILCVQLCLQLLRRGLQALDLQRRCLLALLSQCGDAAECDALLATLAEHSVGAALDHLELGQPGPVYRTVE